MTAIKPGLTCARQTAYLLSITLDTNMHLFEHTYKSHIFLSAQMIYKLFLYMYILHIINVIIYYV